MSEPGRYLEPSYEAMRDWVRRGVQGPVVMLNLLRFREIADYTAHPELAPSQPISGAEAFSRYVAHTMPHLLASGGSLAFLGEGGHVVIGPPDERWDAVMLVRQRSVADFIAFASNADYARGLGHRVAALEDARLLPMVETPAL